MPANPIPLSTLRIDKPCSQNWQSMQGDDRRRFCAQCQHHVHNLSALTERQIQKLLTTTEGRLCGRLERDSFGRLKTRPEKTGWLGRLTKRARTIKLALGSMLAALAANTVYAESSANSSSAAKEVEHTPSDQPRAQSDKKKPNPTPPSNPPVVEKESETIELLWMGIIACEKKPPIKKKYKK